MTPRTGRPPKVNAKRDKYMIRMTADEREKLEQCQKATGLSKAEVIRLGIDKVYQEPVNDKRQ